MKKITSLFLCAAIILTVGCSGGGTSSDTQSSSGSDNTVNAAEPLTAAQTAKAMGLGISLGNTMEAYSADGCDKITYEWMPSVGDKPQDYETLWGAPVTTQEMIDGIRDAGFKTVRIPVYWGDMMENDGEYKINPDFIARVREIVDYCQNDDLFTVINIHHFDEFIIRRHNIDECSVIFNKLWTQIAEYFKDYPYTLVFEGYNEYLGGKQFNSKGELADISRDKGYEMANRLNQVFVDSVRETGGNNMQRVLIASGYWTNIDLTSKSEFVMPTDIVRDRLMISVHYVDNNMYWQNKIGGEQWLKYIDSQCAALTAAFTEKGIPVFMGETTSHYPESNFDLSVKYRDYSDSTKCVETVLKKLLDCGFVPIIWDANNDFYDRNECRLKYSSDRELILRLSREIS